MKEIWEYSFHKTSNGTYIYQIKHRRRTKILPIAIESTIRV